MSKGKKTFSRKEYSRFKIVGIGVLFFAFWGGLWAKAYMLQVVQGEELARKAKGQYWCQKKVHGRRGEIYDRKGLLLAKSVAVSSVYANPVQVEDVDESSRFLARTLGLSMEEVKNELRKKKNFVWIRRKIGDRTAQEIREKDLSGIHLLEEYERVYPQGRLLGQVLGFVGVDGKGLEGLEKSLNEQLQAGERRIVMQRDGSGAVIADPRESGQKVDGEDVALTIDGRLQFAAEEALARAVEKHSGKRGMAIVLKVKTGDVLAWAHYPFFNPNRYKQSSPANWRNHSATDLTEPGSTLKPFLVAAALQENVCKTDSLYFCENGKWEIGGEEINDTHEYDWLPVSKVLRYSSNIGAAKLGVDLGADRFHSYLTRLWFNRPISMPLPGQGKSILRPSHKWTAVDLAAASFGQGLASTPLHLARAYLGLANGGVMKEMNILKDPNQPKSPGEKVFSPEVARKILTMLEDVVQEDGTGKLARIQGVRVGGKTGTAQKASVGGGYSQNYVASFIGLIPAMDPEYLIMCLVDDPEKNIYGGVVAAPVIRDVGTRIVSASDILLAGIEKSGSAASDGVKKSRVRRDVRSRASRDTREGKMPDLRGLGLRTAVEALAGSGRIPSIRGRGTLISKQSPEPGADLDPESPVVLWTEDGKDNG
ncbi:MAG: penicillin-binding transpeptidase domain-containing protein [Desulfonatronovibrionaceae bacterium]